MPSSLGHFTIAYIIYKSKNTLSLPALIVGSIISDVDILFYYLIGGSFDIGREILHSFVGVGLLGTLLSMLLTTLFYPRIVSALLGINREEVKRVCSFSKTTLVSSLIGGFSHVLVDSTCHNYNPLFYPFTRQSIDVLLITNDWRLSYAIVEILLLVLLLLMLIIDFSKRKTKGVWKRLLIGYN